MYKFNWESFSQKEFEDYQKVVQSGQFRKGDPVGMVSTGNLQYWLILKEIGLSPLSLYYDLSIGGKDAGSGGSFLTLFTDESYGTFVQNVEKELSRFIDTSEELQGEAERSPRDIRFGCLGNGTTVYDVANETSWHDYETVAHIQPWGQVRYYVDDLTEEQLRQIDKISQKSAKEYVRNMIFLVDVTGQKFFDESGNLVQVRIIANVDGESQVITTHILGDRYSLCSNQYAENKVEKMGVGNEVFRQELKNKIAAFAKQKCAS